jgi:hypothetical protein
MAHHLPQRWLGIILRIVRAHYPDARLSAWGPVVDEGPQAAEGGHRLELALIDPADPSPDVLSAIRAELDHSDIPVRTDLRPLADLTIDEQEEVLQRGAGFGG